MKMEQTECSETLAYKIQTPGNYPEESIQHSGHGESLKSRKHCTPQVKKFPDSTEPEACQPSSEKHSTHTHHQPCKSCLHVPPLHLHFKIIFSPMPSDCFYIYICTLHSLLLCFSLNWPFRKTKPKIIL